MLRLMLTTFINTLTSAEADAICGAGYGERSAERVNVRNGYRHRDFDTRAGTLDVAILKLRRYPPIPNSPKPSPCSPGCTKTPSGSAPARTTSCARCCASTTQSWDVFTDKRGGLLRPEARVILAAAPTPGAAATLTTTQLAAPLRRAGRHRGIDAQAARI
jgi:hypothetical protein